MNITRSRVREAIARAEARNPLATELDRTATRIEAGDLHVLVEAAKCATFKWPTSGGDFPHRVTGDALLHDGSASMNGVTLPRL